MKKDIGRPRRGLKEYRAWQAMKDRCYRVRATNYKFYGGRGVRVCDRWLKSFNNFLNDVGRAPSDKHTLDRIDSNGDYEPVNCKWSTPVEQSNNTRRNQMVTYRGETKTIAQWSRVLGINYGTLRNRLVNYGFSVEESFLKKDYRPENSGTYKN